MVAGNAASRIYIPTATDLARSIASSAEETPATIFSGCLEYFRADTGITLNGADVSSWLGPVTGFDAIQTTEANQPLFRALGLNSEPEVEFTRADAHRLVDATATGIGIGDRAYLYLVGTITSNANNAGIAAIGEGVVGTSQFYLKIQAAGPDFRGTISGMSDGDAITEVTADTSAHRFEWNNDSGGATLRVGGTEDVDALSGTVNWTMDKVILGDRTGENLPADCKISEFVIVGPAAPSAGEETDYRAYTLAKYGV